MRCSVLALPVLLICAVAAFPGRAAAHVSLELRADPRGAVRGDGLAVDAFVRIESGWHIHANKPRQTYLVPTGLRYDPPPGISAGELFYPPPLHKPLAFAGGEELLLYEGEIGIATTLRVPADFRESRVRLRAELRYQACNDRQCLPPATTWAELTVPVAQTSGNAAPRASAKANGAADHDSRFARWLDERGLAFTLLAVLLLGLGLNLTPCVYPLVSVTVAYFGVQSRERGRAAAYAALYVLGIAVSFSLLGVLAALSGGVFGAALQKPPVIVAIALVLIVLALGNFGLYQFQLPYALTRWAGGSSHGAAGALFMGLTMGVVAAPCVGPIVLGLLVFVGSRQDPQLGFLLFFALAVGMGAPYFALAMAAGAMRSLPRSGEWLVWIERVFGCVLLGLAAYFVAPLLPAAVRPWVLPSVVALCGAYLGFVDRTGSALPRFPLVKRVGGLAAVALAVSIVEPLPPGPAVHWQPLGGQAGSSLDAGPGKPAVIDFAADWCIPCREMDQTTYVDPGVVREAGRFAMLRADITHESEALDSLVARYEVRGVPTVILLGSDGAEAGRLVGYVGPEELLQAMRRVR